MGAEGAAAAVEAPRVYTARRLAEPLGPIDGDLSKPAWRLAEWSEPFGDIRGEEDAPADAQPPAGCVTRVKMLWDESFLYVGALLEYDGPQYAIDASFTERNAPIYQRDSDFEVFVDGAGSTHGYTELELNALNTVWNLRLDKPYLDGGEEHSGRVARPGEPRYWDVRAQRTAARLVRGALGDGSAPAAWAVELALAHNESAGGGWCADAPAPRVPPRAGDAWRINFSRVERRGGINWVWSPQRVWQPAARVWAGVVDMHRPEAWGFVRFADEAGALPDPTAPARPHWRLRRAAAMLYAAQRAHREASGAYAPSVAALHAAQLLDGGALRGLHALIRARGAAGVEAGYVAVVRADAGEHAVGGAAPRAGEGEGVHADEERGVCASVRDDRLLLVGPCAALLAPTGCDDEAPPAADDKDSDAGSHPAVQ